MLVKRSWGVAAGTLILEEQGFYKNRGQGLGNRDQQIPADSLAWTLTGINYGEIIRFADLSRLKVAF